MTMAFGLELATALVLSIVLLLWYVSKSAHKYWERNNIPSTATQIIFGSLKKILLLQESPAIFIDKFYNEKQTKDHSAFGMYLFYTPALVIKDLDVMKRILVKDFNSFSDRYSAVDPHADILGYYNMFFLKNPEWKEMRTSITPVFTSGKLRQMFPLIWEVGKQLDSHLFHLNSVEKTNKFVVEVKNLATLFTTDVIASVAFGIQAHSFENPGGEFRRNGQKIFNFTPMRCLEFGLIFFQPRLGKWLKTKVFTKENTAFLRSAVHSALESREKSGAVRNDLIDVLLTLKKMETKNNIYFNDDMLVGQAGVFFNAGFETASSTMSFAIYELCKNEECQSRLRQEIKRTLEENDGVITYDTLMGMQYMNMVVQEVLRLYPPLPILDRECTATNGFSLEPEFDFVVPKGMAVYIPIYSIQRDPKHFSDSEKFDPERFSPENKDKIRPYSYMPFGYGPRNCIGERLGLIQTKVGLINILKNHLVKATNETPTNIKLSNALITQAEGGIKCELVRDPLLTK